MSRRKGVNYMLANLAENPSPESQRGSPTPSVEKKCNVHVAEKKGGDNLGSPRFESSPDLGVGPLFSVESKCRRSMS